MAHHNYASAARKLVTAAIAMVAVVGFARIVVVVEAECGHVAPNPAIPPCLNRYALCIDEVIAGLWDTTPKKEGFFDSKSYPNGVIGGVTGSASCVPGTNIENCKKCLSTAKASLDECKSVTSGSFSNDVCTMWYGQTLK